MMMIKTLSKRGLALFLVLTMCLSLLPATALADELDSSAEITGGDAQPDDAADLKNNDAAGAAPGEVPPGETGSNGGIALFSMDDGYGIAPQSEVKSYDLTIDGTVTLQGANGDSHAWSIYNFGISNSIYFDPYCSGDTLEVKGICPGDPVLIEHAYFVNGGWMTELFEVKVVVPQQVYVYIHVDGDKNRDEGQLNGLGWYTVGKIQVTGLPNPGTAYENEDGSNPKARYEQYRDALTEALKGIEAFDANEHLIDELGKVNWIADRTEDEKIQVALP